jgi:predicted nucleic acid-binding protein
MSGAEPKVCFIDTNVWLYAFIRAQNQVKTDTAKTLIQSNRVVLSSQVVNEVCVNLIKKTRFDEVRNRNLIQSFYGKYSVAVITSDDTAPGFSITRSS